MGEDLLRIVSMPQPHFYSYQQFEGDSYIILVVVVKCEITSSSRLNLHSYWSPRSSLLVLLFECE